MIAEGDNDPFLLYALAKELEKKSLDEAIEAYENLKQKHKNYVGLYYHLGKCYERKDQLKLAIETYEEGIQEAKKQADFHSLSEINNALMALKD
jgi:tetratricopeptide (TPR) repeat protein